MQEMERPVPVVYELHQSHNALLNKLTNEVSLVLSGFFWFALE